MTDKEKEVFNEAIELLKRIQDQIEEDYDSVFRTVGDSSSSILNDIELFFKYLPKDEQD